MLGRLVPIGKHQWHHPHPGDHARIVKLDTTPERWNELFLDGKRLVVDLRQL